MSLICLLEHLASAKVKCLITCLANGRKKIDLKIDIKKLLVNGPASSVVKHRCQGGRSEFVS